MGEDRTPVRNRGEANAERDWNPDDQKTKERQEQVQGNNRHGVRHSGIDADFSQTYSISGLFLESKRSNRVSNNANTSRSIELAAKKIMRTAPTGIDSLTHFVENPMVMEWP